MLRYIITIAALLLFFPFAQAGFSSTAPVLKLANGTVSNDGHVKIEWDRGVNTAVEVQQSQNKNFEDARMIYAGHDKATFISGLEDGTYYYRIRYPDGAWSDPVALIVKHHSLRLAFVLFSLGAVVFTLTVFIVVKGAYHASVD